MREESFRGGRGYGRSVTLQRSVFFYVTYYRCGESGHMQGCEPFVQRT